MFAVIPVQFAFAVHYFVVWPIAATLSCCLPIFFSNLHAVHTHHKCLQHVTFWVFFLTFLPAVVRYSLFVSLSVLHFCTGGVFAVFPSPFRHSGCIVHLSIALHCTASHCIVLHCIALHCITLYWIALSTSPRLPSALLTWLAVGVSLEIFHSLDFADLQLGGGHQLEVLVQVRTSSVICSLTSAWSSLHSYALSFIARQATF